MIEEALRSPLSVSKLAVNGEDIMKEAGLQPGPVIGNILHALLEEVLDEPEKNDKEYLIGRAKDLSKMPAEEIEKLGSSGKQRKMEEEEKELGDIRKRYGVK